MKNLAGQVGANMPYVSQKLDQKVCPGRPRLFSYPKINLALDILKQDPSGYHEIRTVFHELSSPEHVEWHDELVFEPQNDSLIELYSDSPRLALDETNTVRKAANILWAHVFQQNRHPLFPKKNKGVKIFIKKRIPLMSGLGGGASNATAALKGLAKIWGINCCNKAKNSHRNVRTHTRKCILFKIAADVGMDCPFFINGGTALGEHFGEKITPLPPLLEKLKFKIINTGVEVSSRSVYEQMDIKHCGKNLDKTEKLITALRAGDTAAVIENLHNDFEESVFKKYPSLQTASKVIQKVPGLKNQVSRILLCGSGGALAYVTHNSAAP